MAGDPTNAALWTNADLLIAPLGSPIPASIAVPFSGAWERVGLLDGSAGFAHTRSVDKSDKFAWGQILVRTSRRNFKQELGATLLEYNETTKKIIWPGSSSTRLKVPMPTRMLMATELREGDRVRRLITAFGAEFDTDSFTEGEEELTSFPTMATIFPTADGELWIPQDSNDNPVESLAITGTATVAEGEVTRLIATATFADATTADVSDLAVWISDDDTTATVEYGFVTGIDAGSVDVVASFRGEEDTQAVTVTA